MAGLIFKAPYYKPGHKTESGQSRGGLAKYVATRDGVEILRSGMAEYIGERRGSHGMFTDEEEVVNLSAVGKEMDEHTGNIWGLIFSLTREDAERLGYNSAEEWMNLLRSRRNDIAKEMNIAPENLRWYAAYHNAETHPHVHMLVWSRRPQEPYLSTTGIYNIKQTIAGDIYRQEHLCIYKKQTQARDDLKEEFRARMRVLEYEIRRGAFDFSPQLVQKFSLLCEKLTAHKGRRQYGYLDKHTKVIVDDIVKTIAADGRISELYDLWYKCQCEIRRTYTDEIPDKIPLEENKEFKSLRNKVVATAFEIGQIPTKRRREKNYDYDELRDRAGHFYFLKDQAEQNNVMAMYRLGRYYLERTEDMESAEYWLEKAAYEGNTASMYQIYKAYRDGKFTNTPLNKMKFLRMAVDAELNYAEYEYSKVLKKCNPEMSREYLERAAKDGCSQAEYDYAKILVEEGRQEEAFEYFESAARKDAWCKTSLGLLYCYRFDEWDLGMEHLNGAANQGFTPAQEAVKAIRHNLNAQIVFGVCDLLYYASNIIDDSAEEMDQGVNIPIIDKKQRREIQAKKQGLTMGGM